MLKGNMSEHLNQIFTKIDNNEKFGLIRPSDGEYLILNNHTFTNCDNWTHNSNSLLRKQLMESVKIHIDNLYIGIPCNSCNHSPSGIYNDYINENAWRDIVSYKLRKNRLDENFIEKYNDYFNENVWQDIFYYKLRHNTLDENFINKYQDYLPTQN